MTLNTFSYCRQMWLWNFFRDFKLKSLNDFFQTNMEFFDMLFFFQIFFQNEKTHDLGRTPPETKRRDPRQGGDAKRARKNFENTRLGPHATRNEERRPRSCWTYTERLHIAATRAAALFSAQNLLYNLPRLFVSIINLHALQCSQEWATESLMGSAS